MNSGKTGGSVKWKDRATLAYNVQRLRDERDWSLEDLASASGVHLTTIRGIERGNHMPYMRTVSRLAAAFGLSNPSELLRPERSPEPEPQQPQEIPLVAQLIQTSYNNYTTTSQQLIENYQGQIDELRATLYLIRNEIGKAIRKPYVPSTHYIDTLLYPSPEMISELAIEYGNERKNVNR